jgi:serine/threonine protein phosphatase PrpC
LKVEYADISLLGAREENQDRVTAAVAEHAALLVVVDGMGGHADGARAAEVTQRVLLESFWHTPQPLFDPLGFLHMTLEQRPRATCAVCLVQQRSAWWAHIGDSRIYHMRHGALVARTRDHSHVELLLREGLITVEQVQMHPMRNFVESCLGGDAILPDMSITARQEIESGDVFLVCSDGLWGALRDTEIVARLESPEAALRDSLLALGELSVARGGSGSDNTSAAPLRWLGD